MRTEDITSITHHRDRLREHLDQVKETGRPMFITDQSGEPEAVVMAADTYDKLMEQLELARSLSLLDRSMEEMAANRGKDLRQAVRDIAGSLGLELNR